MLAPATALAIYDFNALVPSPTNPTINGQDGWEVSTFYGTASTPANGYVKSAWGADGSQALYCNPPNGPSGTQMSRPNDASLGMPSFTGPNLQAIETDIYPQCWGVHFGVGYDNNTNGQIDIGTDTGTEVGIRVALGACGGNQWVAGSTTANFSNPFNYQWGRIRMIIDTTANSGQGSGCLFYKLPYNAATWTLVSAAQQVNLNLNPAATDARKAANWNRIFFGCGGADNSGIDNISFESFTPPSDITLSSTAIAENSPANSVIGTLSASPTSSYTYTLVAGTGDTDNGSFTISGSNLQINASPDYETKNSYSLRVKATRDDGGSCVTPFEKALIVTITNQNDNAPIVTDGSVTTNENTAYSGTLPVGSDVDGDSLSYILVSNASKGSVTIANTGTFTYTPNANQSGTDSFTFKANDGIHDSNIATMTITITPAPVIPPPPPVTPTPPAPPLPPMTLKVSLAGTGTGRITSDLGGIDCSPTSSNCTYTVNTPTWVTLTATPEKGSQLNSWTGDPACTATGQVLIVQDTSCTAEFTLKNYQLTANFLGKGRVTGPGIDCPGQCTATYLYGTTVTLTAQATRKMWEFSGWRGCDSQGNITITNDVLCQAVFTPDPNIPNAGDGNGDGLPDAYQDNVVSLPDKVSGTYLTLEAQPATCIISDIYPDLPETQTIKLDHTKKFPQGMLYFDIACPQAQVSVYYHGMSKVYRNLKFYKFGPKIPGDLTTIAWYQLPNIKYEVVMVGEKPVVKGTYTLTDGELGDSTGVDGHLVDPGGVVYP
jgi:hypothetical protein